MKFPILVLLTVAIAFGQTKELDLTPGGGWVDTGLDVQPGDSLKITASGSLQYSNARQSSGPEGLPRGWADLVRQLPVNEAGRGALVGRIGSSDAARAFLIGATRDGKAPVAGRLFLSINQASNDSATGSFHVTVTRTVGAVSASKPTDLKLPPFTQQLIDSIPRRVNDAEGAPGDRVNFILVGSEQRVKAAYQAAGWVTVDKDAKDALLKGALATFSKQAYVTLPMSQLQLFGRSQDYGYAQGDPVRVVASRHHFRIWKAPFTLGGTTVWAGAGTHDIGFDRDQRNNHITHKIDPNTDLERDYIGESLKQTGMVVKTEYLTPTDPVLKAKTAHGEEFSSDGRTLIIYLQPDASSKPGVSFADMFCSVLKQKNPGGESWGPCAKYIEPAGREDLTLGEISKNYRVLIVPGILSSCVSDTPAFQEGQDALKKAGVDVDLLQVPNDSSESNAKMIAQYLKDHAGADPRKYILVGYSKGGPDIQVALAKESGVKDNVAAFITVAGASGGSPIADILPKQAEPYMSKLPMQSCKGDLATGFSSLKQEVRRAFLASYPDPFVPTYSLIAKADRTTISKALSESWMLLSKFGTDEDGQLLKDDAVVPGATFLGAALSDHFALALPFDKSPDATIRKAMDHTTYPRAALLESLVRFVADDLKTAR